MNSVSIPHRYAENFQFFQLFFVGPNKFQSLIGMLKTFFAVPHPLPAKNVSIPHRYAENLIPVIRICLIFYVSIPHRYAENISNNRPSCSNQTMFQSLIGMLKTGRRAVKEIQAEMFQSLIGMLKTSSSSSSSSLAQISFNPS